MRGETFSTAATQSKRERRSPAPAIQRQSPPGSWSGPVSGRQFHQNLTKDHLTSLFKSVALDRERLMVERDRLKAEGRASGVTMARLQRERDAARSSEAACLDQTSQNMVQVVQSLGRKMTALQRQLAMTEEENARLKKRICRPGNESPAKQE